MYACIYSPLLAPDAQIKSLAESITPVYGFAPGVVVLDVRGLRFIYRSPQDIADCIKKKCQEIGVPAAIAVAAHPDAAVVAARGLPGITIIPPGEERQRLAPLPLALLAPSEELQEILAAWGIRTFQQLAALPDTGIAERLGVEGVQLQKLARGQPSKPLVPFREAAVYEAFLDLDHPLELLEPLSFVLSRLLKEICTKLRDQGLAANEVRMMLKLDDATEWKRTIRLPFATRDTGTFLKLLQYDLASRPPDAPVISVLLQAQPTTPRTVQTGFFVPLTPEPEKLELTLTRLAALVGEQNIGSPELIDTHRPGAFRLVRFTPDTAVVEEEVPSNTLSFAIRLFRPPVAADVLVREGKPIRVIAQGNATQVVRYAGPWRTCGDWWTEDPWFRDEWDVSLSDGSMRRIYREPSGGDREQWFIDGSYD